jgi:hypothetical protein
MYIFWYCCTVYFWCCVDWAFLTCYLLIPVTNTKFLPKKMLHIYVNFSYYKQTVLVTAIHSANIDIYISHKHHGIIRHRCIKNSKCHVERFDVTDDGTHYCQHNQSSQYMREDFWTGHCPSAFICTTQGTILNIFHHKVTCLVWHPLSFYL